MLAQYCQGELTKPNSAACFHVSREGMQSDAAWHDFSLFLPRTMLQGKKNTEQHKAVGHLSPILEFKA